MSGAPALPYEYYIDIVTRRYFHGVDNRDLELVLDCFAPDAVLTEVTSGTVHSGRDTGIRTMLTRFFAAYARIWHGNFVHTADVRTARIHSQFTVELTEHGGRELRMENCNRFNLRDGRFASVFIYMSGANVLV